jgi:exodeoxyribonuclease VII large subunit
MIWNSEKIVRAIHQLPKPTIVGIGHERDTCLCEKVADIRASTPTNAAELISITASQVTNHLDGVSQFLQNYFWNRKNEYNQFSQNIFRNITQTINVQIYQNKLVCQKTEQIIFQTIQNTKNSITQSLSIILFETKNQTAIERQKLANFSNYQQILWQKILEYRQTNKSTWQQITQFQNQIIQTYKHQLELYSTKVELYQPQKILALGYSIIEQNGKKLSKTRDIDKSKSLQIQMIDGTIDLKIISQTSKKTLKQKV